MRVSRYVYTRYVNVVGRGGALLLQVFSRFLRYINFFQYYACTPDMF